MSRPQLRNKTEVGSLRSNARYSGLRLRTTAILEMSPQVQLNGSDCSQLLTIGFTAEAAAVKHDLTVGVASECAIDTPRARALRKFSLSRNALGCRVTRVTQRSVFC